MLDETPHNVHALAREVSELRQRVDAIEHTHRREPPDEMLSTFQAAELTGRTRQTITNWGERYGIGYFDRERMRWIISREKLISFCRTHPGASRRAFW